jgi:hypothetical protein
MLNRPEGPFSVRFCEHFRDYKNANNKSKFAEHLLDIHHSFGPMNTPMDIPHLTPKGTMMNTLEKFHIYNETMKLSDQWSPHCKTQCYL